MPYARCFDSVIYSLSLVILNVYLIVAVQALFFGKRSEITRRPNGGRGIINRIIRTCSGTGLNILKIDGFVR